ncbi:hypothetical protein GOBAR_AA26657 [Gossypium barbadense]|uniref:Uncharacterized protein n=1 Tax=Gossypium barbadense TaxID=3634 RepID=A0A2P5WSE9_GOSBA|nr:hypothetical protein GOBAR_AA26657 [Gossypium barbadense]
MLPINYESWHHMPNSNKNQALDNIKERFALEVSDDYMKKALGKKWRDYKSTLKKLYFKKDISLEEKLRNVLPGMLRTVSELEQAAGKNKNLVHTTGSRSFASIAEAEEVSSSQKFRRLQLFEITHRKKDGSPMTSKAGEIMEKLKEKKAEYEVIASIDSSVNLENIDNKIITEVLGPERYGYHFLAESGGTRRGQRCTLLKDLYELNPVEHVKQAQAKVQRLRDQIAQMQASTIEQIAKVQRKYEELQQQLRAEAAAREAAIAAREAEAAVMAVE